jgi:hypothetical protein
VFLEKRICVVLMARSKVQKAQAQVAMAKINSGNKENVSTSFDSSSDGNNSNSGGRPSEAPNLALWTAHVHLLECKRVLHNMRRKLTRAEKTKDKLRDKANNALSDANYTWEKLGCAEHMVASLKWVKNTLWMHDSRATWKLEAAVEQSQSHSLKEKGVFKEEVQEMAWNLTSICWVPLARGNSVIQVVAHGLGVTVEDSIDKHSAARITLEGQVAADMQLVNEIHDAGGKS